MVQEVERMNEEQIIHFDFDSMREACRKYKEGDVEVLKADAEDKDE